MLLMTDISRIVQWVGHELNWANDMERVSFRGYKPLDENTEDFDELRNENFNTFLHNISQPIWICKSFIRGAAVGSIAGAIASAITGYDLQDCISQGARYGLYFDADIFMIRLMYKSLKTQIGKYHD
jgi:hypothetical protein